MLYTKITPCLLFNGQADEAANFYVSIFKKSKITQRTPHLTTFRIQGHDFVALNGPNTEFNLGVSFYVACKNQKEVDYYWNKLRAGGGKEQPCGWVKDKYGLSWQICPEVLPKLINDKNKQRAERTFQAMLKMKKLNIAKLMKAYAG